MATIPHLMTARAHALTDALRVLAASSDTGYLADALAADADSAAPHQLTNTLAVVSTDAEADISSLQNRFGTGTIDELRGLLGIPRTPAIVEAIKPWRSKVDRTRTAIGVQLQSLGCADRYVNRITALDGENLFFSTDRLVEALEALDLFADRTTTINGEDYVLVG